MSSRPSIRRMRSDGAISNAMSVPPGPLMRCATRSTVNGAPPSAATTRAAKASCSGWPSSSGSTPFCRQFSRKISAKLRATMQRMPRAISAHTAVSRDEPQPKFEPPTRIAAL